MEDKVLEMFNNGFNSSQIEKELSITYQKVCSVLYKFGIDYKKEYLLIQENKYDEALRLYQEGKSTRFIAEKLKIGRNQFRAFLKEKGIDIRSSKEGLLLKHSNLSEEEKLNISNAHKRYDIDDNSFEDHTSEEAAYWIGFMYADGTIRKSETTFSLSLKESDKSHLEKFCNFLKTPLSRLKYVKSNNSYQLTIGNRVIVKKLEYLGVINNKTYFLKPHKDLIDNKHFWRGVIDGDGCLGLNNVKNSIRVNLDICGTFETCECFKDFLEKETQRDLSNIKINQVSKTFYTFRISSLYSVIDISNFLYKDSVIYLDRKYNKYLEIQKLK